ncbi:hypothetical protein CEXT_6361, partial [Caerostris extrusa]
AACRCPHAYSDDSASKSTLSLECLPDCSGSDTSTAADTITTMNAKPAAYTTLAWTELRERNGSGHTQILCFKQQCALKRLDFLTVRPFQQAIL